MKFGSTEYHFKNIRALLIEGFDDGELRDFCYDEPKFRPVHNRLVQITEKSEIVRLIIEHANQHLLFEILLPWAKENNPDRYKKHQPYYQSFYNIFLGADQDWLDQIEPIPSGDTTDFIPLTWLNSEGQQALEIALGESLRIGRFWLGVEFLLMGLSKQEGTVFRMLLQEIGVRPRKFRSLLRGAVGTVAEQDWQEQDFVIVGAKTLLSQVREVAPDLLRQNIETKSEPLLVITPRLLTILKDAVKLAGAGEVGHNHLLWATVQHHRSLAMQLLFRQAFRVNRSPEQVAARVAELTGIKTTNLVVEALEFPGISPHLEILNGPLDGHVDILRTETFWGQTGQGPLSFPWDVELGMPQARFFFEDGGWWLESYPAPHGTYCFNRQELIKERFRLEPGDILKASDTWLLMSRI